MTDKSRFYETESRRAALACLSEGLGERQPFVLLTGPAGTGKTVLVREAVRMWGERAAVSFVANPALSRTELVEEIARRFGGTPPANATKPQLLACLEEVIGGIAAGGRTPVVVVDDAHELHADLLGELRLLVNATTQRGVALEVVLVGLPELETRLTDPAFTTLRQRVGVHGRVSVFSSQETRRYLEVVLGGAGRAGAASFPRKTSREIFKRTRGVASAVEVVAAAALRAARDAGAPVVAVEHVHAATASLTGLADVAPSMARGGSDDADEPAVGGGEHEPNATDSAEGVAQQPPVRPVAPTRAASHRRPSAPEQLEPEPVPSLGPVPIAADGEGRTEEWVGRFIRPDEPRFGELLGSGASRPSFDVDSPFGAEMDADGGDAIVAVGRDADAKSAAPVPARRRHRARRRSAGRVPRGRPHAWVVPTAFVLLVLSVTATLTFWSRGARTNAAPAARDTAAVQSDASVAGGGIQASSTGNVGRRGSPQDPVDSKPAAPSDRLALDVGTYLNFDRAMDERGRLVTETGLRGWIVPDTRDGATVYRVVLGIYSTEERAETSANVLLARHLISEARVIPLPPRSRRR